MKEIGLMICNMGLVKKVGLMDQFTKANTWQERSTAGVCTDGTTAASTRASGPRTKLKASACTHGSTDASTKENG